MVASTSWMLVTFVVGNCALWTTTVAASARGPTAVTTQLLQHKMRHPSVGSHITPVRRRKTRTTTGRTSIDDDDNTMLSVLLQGLRGGSGWGDYGDGNNNSDDDDDEEAYYRGQQQQQQQQQGMTDIIKNGDRRIGLLLLFSGTAVTMTGITLFFQKTLMRLGNLLFIAGVPITIGPSRTVGYFMQPKKTRATACLAAGVFLVLVAGRPVLGIALEIFGLMNLFGNMFPVVLAIANNITYGSVLVSVLVYVIQHVKFDGTIFGLSIHYSSSTTPDIRIE
jgi:hypothetical protein